MINSSLILMAGGGNPIEMFIMMGLMIALMYLLLIRPQRKKQKEHEQLLNELKKGDKVVTSGGMFGTIFALDDERKVVVLKVGGDVKIEVLKSSVAGKVES